MSVNFPTPDTHVRKLGTQRPYSDVSPLPTNFPARLRATLTLCTTEQIRHPSITHPTYSPSDPPNSVSAGLITFARSRLATCV